MVETVTLVASNEVMVIGKLKFFHEMTFMPFCRLRPVVSTDQTRELPVIDWTVAWLLADVPQVVCQLVEEPRERAAATIFSRLMSSELPAAKTLEAPKTICEADVGVRYDQPVGGGGTFANTPPL